MEPLAGLNVEQTAAVKHGKGPLLVVAGAGTGKTRVITHRIAHLIETGAAEPGAVLALTFTEKAAQEMAERLYDLIGWRSFQVPVMTFNAFGAELLGRFATHIGRSTRGGLINETQKALLIKQQFDDIHLEYFGLQANIMEFIEQIVAYIGRLQNAGVELAAYEAYLQKLEKDPGELHSADVAEQRDLVALYRLYEAVKAETGTYDYYDQLALPLRILHEYPNLAQRLAQQYGYVLVDEYQDTSPVQDALLRAFVPPDGNIFAVGDDDQAIYRFRGAEIGNILAFSDHFKVKKPIVLVQNYRSGQPILDAAYRLIRHNDPQRLEVELGLDKRLVAQSSKGSVAFRSAVDPAAEQQWVVEEVAQRINNGEIPSEIAILGRSNALLRGYANALRARKLPFAISTNINVFEQRELLQLWHLLQWLAGRASGETIGHLLLGPFIGWNATQVQLVSARAARHLIDYETALRELAAEGDKPAATLVVQLDEWRRWAASDPVSRLSYRLVFETGLADRLQDQAQAGYDSRIVRVFDDLHRLLQQMQDFETVEIDGTLVAYLAVYPTPPELEASEAMGDPDGVQLLTVHAAKGLEFDVVYLVGCSARAWTERSQSSYTVPEPLQMLPVLPAEHEERRLMYVAATRARRELILTAPATTGSGNRSQLSPLVNELLGESPLIEKGPDRDPAATLTAKLEHFYPLRSELPDRLYCELPDGWLELGVGDLSLYASDPHDFFVQKVLKISQPFGPQLSFGTAVHGIIEAYYQTKLRGEAINLAELQVRLDELWSDRGYESRIQAEQARAKAHETVLRFYEREESTPRVIASVEQPVRFELPEAKLRLKGRLDATFRITDGLEIRDFKTGHLRDGEAVERRLKDATTREAFQLRTYALAVEQLTGRPPSLVSLDYVVTGAQAGIELTSRVLANHRQKLVGLAESIRRRNFNPPPSSPFHRSAAYRYWGSEEDEALDD